MLSGYNDINGDPLISGDPNGFRTPKDVVGEVGRGEVHEPE